MKKIRINELARELEVKAHEILDRLPELGVAEKKTHSSSIDEDVAIKLRRLLGHEVPGPGTHGGGSCWQAEEAAPEAAETRPDVTTRRKLPRSRKKHGQMRQRRRRSTPGLRRRTDSPSVGSGKADPSTDVGAGPAIVRGARPASPAPPGRG